MEKIGSQDVSLYISFICSNLFLESVLYNIMIEDFTHLLYMLIGAGRFRQAGTNQNIS